MSCAHGCGGTGRLGSHLEVPCPCSQEDANDALDRVKAQLELSRAENAELQELLLHTVTERDAIRAQLHRVQSAFATITEELARV